jgi:hypothetical protein
MTRIFFQCLEERRWKDAESSRKKIQNTKINKGAEWMKGYLNAFDGMLISLKKPSTRPTPFILMMEKDSLTRLEELKKTFNQESKRQLNAEFDRGFYSTWSEYIDFLLQKQLENVS